MSGPNDDELFDRIEARRNDREFMGRIRRVMAELDMPVGTDSTDLLLRGAIALPVDMDADGYREGFCVFCDDPIYTNASLGMWVHGATLRAQCARVNHPGVNPSYAAPRHPAPPRSRPPSLGMSFTLNAIDCTVEAYICDDCGSLVSTAYRLQHTPCPTTEQDPDD